MVASCVSILFGDPCASLADVEPPIGAQEDGPVRFGGRGHARPSGNRGTAGQIDFVKSGKLLNQPLDLEEERHFIASKRSAAILLPPELVG